MSFYRPINFTGPASKGADADTADGGQQIMDNGLSCGNQAQAGEQLLADTATGGTGAAAAGTGCEGLPDLKLDGTAGAGDGGLMSSLTHAMQSIGDIASKLADPTGFIAAIFEFLKALFSMDLSGAMNVLSEHQLHTYSQAAADSAEWLKKQLGS